MIKIVKLVLSVALFSNAVFCAAQQTEVEKGAPLNLDTANVSKEISAEQAVKNKRQTLTLEASPFATVFNHAEQGPHFSGMIEVGVGVGRESIRPTATRVGRSECSPISTTASTAASTAASTNAQSSASASIHPCPPN